MSIVPVKRFNTNLLIAVGDPKQLPPVLNDSKKHSVLKKTLFERLASTGNDPILLRTQYRLHPALSRIANSLFYDNKLLDGVSENDRASIIQNFPPLLAMHVQGNEVSISGSKSWTNKTEAQAIGSALHAIIKSGIPPSRVGVISLYKDQVDLIQQIVDAYEMRNEKTSMKKVQIATVDSFQGAEKDIIILSTVRTAHHNLSFIADPNRLNVAITRVCDLHPFIVYPTLITPSLIMSLLHDNTGAPSSHHRRKIRYTLQL
jgi:superfamily I DNA and/or RNA helicase